MKLNGLMWWIDRWRKSTAYTDMTLEQQGAYRNLLDEAWLRGGKLPNNPKVLAKASGDPVRWPVVRPVVMKWFRRERAIWRNETLSEVYHQARRRAENQYAYRARRRNTQNDNEPDNAPDNEPDSPDPDLKSKTPLPPFGKGGRLTRAQLKAASDRRARVFGGCPHSPRCANYAECVAELAQEQKARA